MFRKILREKQALSAEECEKILTDEPRGVLAVAGDDGYPYAVPMNFWFDRERGRIYFHGGKVGHKIDALKRCDKVSFCVYDRGFRRDGEWALNIKSVIVFGRIRFVTDEEETVAVSRKLSLKYTSDSAYIEREIRFSAKNTLCLELIPECITGKIVNES